MNVFVTDNLQPFEAPAYTKDPAVLLEEKESRDALREDFNAALKSLSPEAHWSFSLCTLWGKDSESVARILNLKPKRIAQLNEAARNRLRRRLAPYVQP